ncbi:MAG: 16S rRNA (cytosine(1402)-N(4))-methyltransferase RsmH [Nitrospirae bacterium]|nr:16S rRNA (cytosine(1402)-N(4))-methyltransferase RsmH [Nitrospirota bacterium]
MVSKSRHVPVLGKEVCFWLISQRPMTLLDCTVGYGGHAELLLESCMAGTTLIGLDRDSRAIDFCRQRLIRFGEQIVLQRGNHRDLKQYLAEAGVSAVDGVLFDFGVSSPQLDDPARGFSFQQEGPLDMRMDQTSGLTATELVNRSPEDRLADIIFQYGEERYSRRIARAIVRERERRPIETTGALTSVIAGSVPSSYRHGRIHCATRTFQALRMAVNLELESLEPSLRNAVDVLAPGGRICAISFHSLEDRIVKHTFRSLAQGSEASLSLLTKKPVLPTEEECRVNPRARSAKLRVVERLPARMA